MPQVILHVCRSLPDTAKADLVRAVREAIPRILGIPAHIGQVVLYEADPAHRAIHPSRDHRFVIVEAMMYPGRTQELKTALMQKIIGLITKHTGVAESDIIATIHEIPPEHYFDGTSHAFIAAQKHRNDRNI
ncbi:MAG TPA: tautomerase family protein [Candidatus Baltobacteraceae bacterium]|nr:tautomerase family protein [Candidatus Baltobacteraceae bacterium]